VTFTVFCAIDNVIDTWGPINTARDCDIIVDTAVDVKNLQEVTFTADFVAHCYLFLVCSSYIVTRRECLAMETMNKMYYIMPHVIVCFAVIAGAYKYPSLSSFFFVDSLVLIYSIFGF